MCDSTHRGTLRVHRRQDFSRSHCPHPPSILCLCVISSPAHAIRWVLTCAPRTAAHTQRVPFDDDEKISSTGDDARAKLQTRAYTHARSTAEQHQQTPPACTCTPSKSLAFRPLTAMQSSARVRQTSTSVERRPPTPPARKLIGRHNTRETLGKACARRPESSRFLTSFFPRLRRRSEVTASVSPKHTRQQHSQATRKVCALPNVCRGWSRLQPSPAGRVVKICFPYSISYETFKIPFSNFKNPWQV
jgi:hypothetical protein